MLFKGTRKRSAKDISQAVEGVGGYLNAFTGEESTCFHARAGHKHFAAVLDVLMDMLLNSQFAPRELTKERAVIKEEIAMYLDEPQHHVQELLNATLWPGQSLGRPITGTSKTLNSLHRAQLLAYVQKNYVADSVVIVAAGQVNHGQLVRAVQPYLKRFPVGPRPECPAARNEQSAPRVRLFSKRIEQTRSPWGSARAHAMTNGGSPCDCSTRSWARI